MGESWGFSVGASMDSGKTTTVGYLARSLKGIWKKVAYLKLTGTAYKKDTDFVSGFSEVGFPSAYHCETEELMDLYQTLFESVSAVRPADIIVEIADGLYQRETSFLLKNGRFFSTVYAVLLSCGDSLMRDQRSPVSDRGRGEAGGCLQRLSIR